jgi:hypothetical protein
MNICDFHCCERYGKLLFCLKCLKLKLWEKCIKLLKRWPSSIYTCSNSSLHSAQCVEPWQHIWHNQNLVDVNSLQNNFTKVSDMWSTLGTHIMCACAHTHAHHTHSRTLSLSLSCISFYFGVPWNPGILQSEWKGSAGKFHYNMKKII